MNGMNGFSPELSRRFVRDYQQSLMREAAATRAAGDRRKAVSRLRLVAGRMLVRVGQALAGPAALPSADRRTRIRTAKADGC